MNETASGSATDDPSGQLDALLCAARASDRATLARLLSVAEREGRHFPELNRRVHRLGGSAYTVGITGAPGAGKSTLTGRVINELRVTNDAVAVLAVDPSSSFSGGAILGDRIRMHHHVHDPGVFIRSMATRGHLGGLAAATQTAIRNLDAARYPWVLIETVGVGQVEVEIAGVSDTTVVVINPGWGDGIQAAKAGLLEIADVFVINKADRSGAKEAAADLSAMLDLAEIEPHSWRAPIVETTATMGRGCAELVAAIRRHRSWAESSGVLARRRHARAVNEVRSILAMRIADVVDSMTRDTIFTNRCEAILDRQVDPWTAANELFEKIGSGRLHQADISQPRVVTYPD